MTAAHVRLGVLLALVLGIGLLPAVAVADEPAPVLPVNDPLDRGTARERFLPGDYYTGYFADPAISRVDGHYVAASTSRAGNVLPLMTSPDLLRFTPRAYLSVEENLTGARKSNDAMAVVPTWPVTQMFGARPRIAIWAPSSIVKINDRYLLAYSAHRALGKARRSCIGIAWANTAAGPYADERNRPLVCFDASQYGAIDPDIFTDSDGSHWLLWKQEGISGVAPPKLVTRRLAPDGLGFAAGSAKTVLLRRDSAWEGGVVENPAMVKFRGRYYLFYSGGDWWEASYGTGYGVCKTAAGPCTKVTTKRPLLGSGGAIQGTGGADAIVDTNGALRLVYAAWDAGRVGKDPKFSRRMHVATAALGAPRRVARPTKPLALRSHSKKKKFSRVQIKRARKVWQRRLANYRWAVQVERSRLKVTQRAATRDPIGPLTLPETTD